jgi:predicted nuclease of restriction endonuclease-like RecB superfamily
MWSDLDENLLLENFNRITPATLVAWYNFAIMQTLLFSCITLQLTLHGGSNWKRVLRDVKRVGLMYNIRNERTEDNISHDNMVVCSLDGPLSIFKMTEIYGTAIAKILPPLISSESWSLQAWIVRKSISAGRKMYEFDISKENAPPLIALPDQNMTAKINSKSVSSFDSRVEEKFAIIFQQAHTGWTLIREPDPVILDNDKAFIPDFMFEKYGRRVYLEIVGFWTMEYIERKIHKLTRISSSNNELCKDNKLDIFIAVNSDYFTTLKYKNFDKELSKLGSLVQKGHLILYNKGQVPLRPILSYLKSIDQEIIRRLASNAPNDLLAEIDGLTMSTDHDKNEDGSRSEGDGCGGIISIDELAKKYDIPSESVLMAIRSREAGNVNLNVNDNTLGYVIVGTYLIPQPRMLELEKSLTSISTFLDAASLFNKYKLPESCYVDLLSKLGYDIIWKGIDSTNASLEKRKRNVDPVSS